MISHCAECIVKHSTGELIRVNDVFNRRQETTSIYYLNAINVLFKYNRSNT